MEKARGSRVGFYLWALLVCPVIGVLTFRFGTVESFAEWVVSAGILPALLALAGGGISGRRASEAVGGAVAASLLGGFGTFVYALWAVASAGGLD